MLYESPYDQGFIIPEVDITTLVLDHNLKVVFQRSLQSSTDTLEKCFTHTKV